MVGRCPHARCMVPALPQGETTGQKIAPAALAAGAGKPGFRGVSDGWCEGEGCAVDAMQDVTLHIEDVAKVTATAAAMCLDQYLGRIGHLVGATIFSGNFVHSQKDRIRNGVEIEDPSYMADCLMLRFIKWKVAAAAAV